MKWANLKVRLELRVWSDLAFIAKEFDAVSIKPAEAAPARKSRLDIETFFSFIFELLNIPVLEPDLAAGSNVFNIAVVIWGLRIAHRRSGALLLTQINITKLNFFFLPYEVFIPPD